MPDIIGKQLLSYHTEWTLSPLTLHFDKLSTCDRFPSNFVRDRQDRWQTADRPNLSASSLQPPAPSLQPQAPGLRWLPQ